MIRPLAALWQQTSPTSWAAHLYQRRYEVRLASDGRYHLYVSGLRWAAYRTLRSAQSASAWAGAKL